MTHGHRRHAPPRLPSLATLAVLALAGAAGLTAPVCAQPGAVWPSDVPGVDGWSLQLRSERHADALALDRLGRPDWAKSLSPRQGRNLAWVDDEARLTIGQAGWQWALLARSQARLVASADALRLAAQVANGERPADDRAWQVQARLQGFAGAGLALGRRHQWDTPATAAHGKAGAEPLAGATVAAEPMAGGLAPAGRAGLTLDWELQALALGRWRERQLDGTVAYTGADQRYRFGLASRSLGERIDYPFRQPTAHRGQALLLAARLGWQSAQGVWLQAGLRDAGWLRWQGMPQQDAVLDTEARQYDADGFIVYQPLVQGRYGQAMRQRWLVPQTTLAGGLQWPAGDGARHRAGLAWRHLPGWGGLPVLQWQRLAETPSGWSLGAAWHLHQRRLTLQAAWRGLGLTLGADRLDGQARSRELALGWQQAF